MIIKHKFVDEIPELLDNEVLYISIDFGTAVHKCFCGCQSEVVSPLTPSDWKLIFDGETVSLDPSIGSWNLPCRSHYWVRNDSVVWAEVWSEDQIKLGRQQSILQKDEHYRAKQDNSSYDNSIPVAESLSTNKAGLWSRLMRFLGFIR